MALMPITSSAKKALRASAKKRVFNLRRKNAMIDAIKQVRKLFPFKDKKAAQTALSTAFQAIDKATRTHFITKNTAARKKSRLALFINKAAK